MKDFISLGLALGALLACGQSATGKQLAVRAVSDLGCENEQIQTYKLDSRTMVASGCGREATYVESCETCTNGLTKMNETCNCTWVLNGAVRSRSTTPIPCATQPPPTAAVPASNAVQDAGVAPPREL